jgi:hypothetical protein
LFAAADSVPFFFGDHRGFFGPKLLPLLSLENLVDQTKKLNKINNKPQESLGAHHGTYKSIQGLLGVHRDHS